ncbi:MAG TPA: citrate synthase [Pseudonocardiaceae bacterium]|jgi:citrate synthase|nr:citrate synthase [Pseudonocardiaceae bacterium]
MKGQVMAADRDERYLTTAEVARRLEVKPATVYAYVSRGLLNRIPGKRGSLFAESEVSRLVGGGRESRRPANPLGHVATSLSLLADDELYFRGRRATDLATTSTVEAVAQLLWTGELTEPEPFTAPRALLDAVRSAIAALPASARLTDQLRVAVAVAGAADPLRFDLAPAAVIRAARTLLAVLVDCIAPAPRSGPLADRLWPALTDQPQPPGLLNATLILLADHDLAVSTVAARVAASARAHPYAVVSAGLGALDGHYHGTASTQVYRFLAEALADPVAALSERLRAGVVPGFGHRVYQHRDPRAVLLFDLLRAADPDSPVLAAVEAINAELPTVDVAIAALMHEYGLRPDAGEAIFAIARTVGWIAHAMEEYREPGLRFRPVGVYIGERPQR